MYASLCCLKKSLKQACLVHVQILGMTLWCVAEMDTATGGKWDGVGSVTLLKHRNDFHVVKRLLSGVSCDIKSLGLKIPQQHTAG